MTKRFKKIFPALALALGVPFVVLACIGIYRTIDEGISTSVPVTVKNDTDKAVKATDCFSKNPTLNAGQSGTFNVYPNDPRASCEIINDHTEEYIGCLFMPISPDEHKTFLVSGVQTSVPSHECGVPR